MLPCTAPGKPSSWSPLPRSSPRWTLAMISGLSKSNSCSGGMSMCSTAPRTGALSGSWSSGGGLTFANQLCRSMMRRGISGGGMCRSKLPRGCTILKRGADALSSAGGKSRTCMHSFTRSYSKPRRNHSLYASLMTGSLPPECHTPWPTKSKSKMARTAGLFTMSVSHPRMVIFASLQACKLVAASTEPKAPPAEASSNMLAREASQHMQQHHRREASRTASLPIWPKAASACK
mmetsp:Transcript_80498/g.249755  ORF Transcript_80498/g.249755 Transcript_80498/m.249755 type:complete len:234 (-) Transcript_80498:314-1015(-)